MSWLTFDLRFGRRDYMTGLPWYAMRRLGVVGAAVMAVCNLFACLWPAWAPMSAYLLSLAAWLLEWLCRSTGVVMPFDAWSRDQGYCVFPAMHLAVFIIIFSMPLLWAAGTGQEAVLYHAWGRPVLRGGRFVLAGDPGQRHRLAA